MGRIELTAEKFAELFGGKPVVDEGDDPEFMRILQRFIFGEVFYTGDLDDQTRELITVSVLTANQTLPQLTVHVRAAVQGVAQLVGDGVLDFERAELGVADALADAVEVDGEGTVGVNVFVPRHRAGEGVDVVGVCDFAFGDNPEDAARHARPEAEAVGGFEVARAGDDGDAEARVLQAEGFGFLEEDLFAAFGAGEDEGVLHGVPCWVGSGTVFTYS